MFTGPGFSGNGDTCVNVYLQAMANETINRLNVQAILTNATRYLVDASHLNKADATSLVTILNGSLSVRMYIYFF